MSDQTLYRSLRGDTTPAEEEAVRTWRTASPDHERRYKVLAQVIGIAAARDERVDAGEAPAARELVWRAEARGSSRPLRRRTGARSAAFVLRWTVAAAALVVLAIGVSEYRSRLARGGFEFEVDEFVTGKAETATVRLSDGSVVRLAPESRLRLIGGDRSREVALEGRAFFAVAPQPGKRFRVRTRAGDAVVLGTRFQVETGPSDVRVIVIEGRVALSGNGREVEVGGGQMSRIADGMTAPVVTVPDLRPMTDWVGNFLVFQSTPLRHAALEIEQKYDVTIEIADSVLAERTLTMWFADRTLDEILTIICTVVDARCFIDNGIVTIGP